MTIQLTSPLLATSLTLLASSLSAQTVLHVPSQYQTIQGAIHAAPATNAEIRVASGTYSISSPIDTLGKAVHLRAIGLVTLDAHRSSRLFTIRSGEGPNTVIEGFSLENGQAPINTAAGGIGDGGGGALIQNFSSPRFVDCVFRSCYADNGGPGHRGGHGGGVYVSNSAPLFDRCTFNSCRSGNGGNGRNGSTGFAGTLTIFDAGDGGDGQAGGRGGHGSAAYVEGQSNARFENCMFLFNRPGDGGDGGRGGNGGSALFFAGFYNGDGGDGGNGGDAGHAGSGTVLVAGNASTMTVNCTFADNSLAPGGRGGSGGNGGSGLHGGSGGSGGTSGLPTSIPGVSAGSTNTEVLNTVFWNHAWIWQTSTPVTTTDVAGALAFDSASRGSILGVGCFTTPTRPIDPSYRPIPFGPLVDAGESAYLPSTASVDARGNPRRFDHYSLSGILDIGAIEDVTGDWAEFGCGNNPANSLWVNGAPPAIGNSFTIQMDDPTSTINNGSLAVVVFDSGAPALGVCGRLVPNFGLVPGQAGESLLPTFELLDSAFYNGAPLSFPTVVPNSPNFVGYFFRVQGVFLDVTAARVGLTRGIWGHIGR